MARRAVIAIAQLTSTADVAANAQRCVELIERAAQGRAEVRAPRPCAAQLTLLPDAEGVKRPRFL